MDIDRLKQIWKDSGLSDSQIYGYLGVDIYKETNITLDVLERTCDLFGCSLRYFHGEEEKYIPLKFKYLKILEKEDLEVIAAVNKIAVNLRGINSEYEKIIIKVNS